MGKKHKINEIKGVVVSRALLEEYGYDGDLPTDEQLQTIANELLDYWSVSKGYEDALAGTMSNMFGIEPKEQPMETKELTTHQHGVILRGICGGAALRDKSPRISENNTVITTPATLSGWDICCISSDAGAFGLKAQFGYDGQTKITFTWQEKTI